MAILTKEELYQEYYVNNLTDREIGLKYRCDETNIRKLRKKFDIKTIPHKERVRRISKEKLIEEYVINKKTMPEIAKEYNISIEALTRYKKEFQIKTVSRLERLQYIYPNELQYHFGLQILYGTLLGDSYLNHTTENVRIQLKHCRAQLDWLIFKKDHLSSFLNMRDIKILKPKGNFKNAQDSYYCYSTHHFWLTEFYSMIYNKNGIKYISKQYLDLLDETGVATWFIDDGSYANKIYGLHTNCFNYDEQLIIQQYFKEKWNIKCSILKKSRNKNEYYLSFSTESSKNIRQIIENLAKNINGLEYKYTDVRLKDYKKVVHL